MMTLRGRRSYVVQAGALRGSGMPLPRKLWAGFNPPWMLRPVQRPYQGAVGSLNTKIS